MVRRQAWAVALLFLLLGAATGHGALDLAQQNTLNASLASLEQLYNGSKWDEAIAAGRQLMKEAPAGSPVRMRAYDIVVLSIDKQSAEKMAKEKADDRAKRKQTGADLTAAGNKLLGEKKYAEAVDSFKGAIKAFGGDAEAWYLYGYALQQKGDREEAYRAYQSCLKRNPDHPRALFHLAELAYAFKNAVEAEEYTRRLIAAIDKRIEELAAAFLEQKAAKLTDKAVATARRINALKKNLAQATYVYGLLTKAAGEFETAKEALKRSTQLDPTSLDAYYHLGRAYLKLRIFHQSSLAFEQAIAMGEDRVRELKTRAKKLLDQNKADEAVEAEVQGKALQKRLVQCYYGLAVCNWSRRDVGTAMESVDKALELDPDFQEARFARAVFLASRREFMNAVAEMRTVLRKSPPKSPEAARAIKAIKMLMGQLTRQGETPLGSAAVEKPDVYVYESGQHVKHLPGMGGRRAEKDLSQLYPGFREVQDLLNRRNIPEAIRRLLAMQMEHQDVVEIPNVLGWCYMELGRFEEALDSFKKARALDPRHAESLSNIAYIYSLKGKNLDQALELANEAIALEPGRAEFHHTRGWVRFKLGEIDKAIADLERALAIRPAYLLARYNLGLAWYLSTDYAKALDCFDQVLAAKPDHTKASLFKAITLAKTGKAPEAIALLDELQKRLPPTEVVARVVKDLHARLSAAHERHTDLPVPRIATTVPIAKLLEKAMAFRAKGLVNHAREVYLELQRLAPNEFEPWYQLGDMYARAGLSSPALRAWERAAQLNPNHYDLQLSMGKMQYRLRKRDQARDAFVKAQGIAPHDPDPPYYLGLMAYEERQFEAAESYGLAAVRAHPRHLKSWALLGMTRIRLARFKPARDAYETLYAHAPADSSIKRHARKKLWELARLMAPGRAPSFDHAADVAQQLTEKNTGDGRPAADLPAPGPAKPDDYGPSMSFDEKMWVLKHLQNFPVLGRQARAAPAKTGKQAALTTDERRWVSKKLDDFKAKALRYAPPAVKMSSKYALHERGKPARTPDPADEFVRQGIEAAGKGFMGEALAAFTKAREASPKNLEVLMNLGYLHLLAGNFKDAFDAVGEATVHHPANPFPRLALGNLYWLGGKGQAAVEQWNLMGGPIRFDPEYVLLGRSEKVWKQVLDTNPSDVDAHSNLAVIYLFTGRFPEAIAECKNVVALAPARAEHQFYQAMAETILFLKAKSPTHKKEARGLLNVLEFMAPPFPHARPLRMYVDTL
ncbi:MAG: tetratricopeptide repeat protein [Candidatus Riflebacteria bacterium]|nr:tetratricopeptide repeat protein [Candidatus Riflebacteria bacterium]